MKCRLCGYEIDVYQRFDKMAKNISILSKESRRFNGVSCCVYHCSNCDLYQIPNMVNDVYYDDYLMSVSFSEKLNRLQEQQLKNICEYTLNNDNFLEIGCGDGNFLQKAASVFSYTLGIEPSKKFYDICNEKKLNVKNVYFDNDIKFTNKFDVIVSRQVFEHLENPMNMLKNMVDLLDDDGIIFLDVPNGKRTIVENRYYEIFSDHINHYTISSLVYLAENTGLDVIAIKESCNGDYLEIYCRKTKEISKQSFNSTIEIDADRINEILNKYDRVAVWGGGGKTQAIFTINGKILRKIVAIFDSDIQKQGKYVVNCPVPIQLPSFDKIQQIDAIIIFAKYYSDEITDTLKEKYQFNGKVFII